MEFYIVNKIDGITYRYYSKDMNNFQKDSKLLTDTQGKSITHLASKEKQFKRLRAREAIFTHRASQPTEQSNPER